VFAGGGSVIYSIAKTGDLRWYRHLGSMDGRGPDVPDAWRGDQVAGRGWQDVQQVFSGGYGVIYAITGDGNLHWFRQTQYPTAPGTQVPSAGGSRGDIQLESARGRRPVLRLQPRATTTSVFPGQGPRTVAAGWGGFKHVFSTGEGVIYAVGHDGTLKWFKHNGYLDGRGVETPGAWETPRDVGSGWQHFTRIFSPGLGVIYAIAPDGSLSWFKHDDYKNPRIVIPTARPSRDARGGIAIEGVRRPGAASATEQARVILRGGRGPRIVGTGWQEFAHVFALLPGASDEVIR
jgi:hypothetical protein